MNGAIAKNRKKQIETKVQENNLKFRESLSARGAPLYVLVEEVKRSDSLFVAQGFDEYYNKIQITSKNVIAKDQWLEIKNFTAKMDKNYAEI